MTQRTTLTQLFSEPNSAAPAVITESPAVVVSYKALSEQIDRLSEQLRRAGLRSGDCVVMVLPNGLEFLVVFLALAQAGLIAAPLNGAYKTDELVLRGDTDAQQLQAFCRTRLADFKVLRVICITSALPKNETGKIERRDLAALFARRS